MKNNFGLNAGSSKMPINGILGSNLNHVLAGACCLLMVGLPLATLFGLLNVFPTEIVARLGVAASAPFSILPWQRAVVALLGMLPVLCIGYALFSAWRVFSGFAANEYFNINTVKGLRGLGAGVFGSGCVGLITTPLIGLILTLQATTGGHALNVGVGSTELLGMLFGGIAWQIASVMTKAVELSEENAQFV